MFTKITTLCLYLIVLFCAFFADFSVKASGRYDEYGQYPCGAYQHPLAGSVYPGYNTHGYHQGSSVFPYPTHNHQGGSAFELEQTISALREEVRALRLQQEAMARAQHSQPNVPPAPASAALPRSQTSTDNPFAALHSRRNDVPAHVAPLSQLEHRPVATSTSQYASASAQRPQGLGGVPTKDPEDDHNYYDDPLSHNNHSGLYIDREPVAAQTRLRFRPFLFCVGMTLNGDLVKGSGYVINIRAKSCFIELSHVTGSRTYGTIRPRGEADRATLSCSVTQVSRACDVSIADSWKYLAQYPEQCLALTLQLIKEDHWTTLRGVDSTFIDVQAYQKSKRDFDIPAPRSHNGFRAKKRTY